MSTKTNVLSFLEENKGKSVSGQELADKLSLSRTAIWKSVRELKKDGYLIDGKTNKGYQFSDKNDIISESGIRLYLKPTIEKIEVFNTIASTNQYAKECAINGCKSGLVIANEQTEGKGRLGRIFYSPAYTGIYLSLIIRPNLTAKQATLITTAACVAVCRAIKTILLLDVSIKWVNDIFYKGKKVCGILTEAVTELDGSGIDFIVLGIGINLNSEFPEELKNIAGNLIKTVTRNRLIAEIINELYSISDNFLEEYKERSIVIGKNVEVVRCNNHTMATVLDIDDNAGLVVKYSDNTIETLSSGEISIRGDF